MRRERYRGMQATQESVVGFDARYVSDRYHGIGRHAYHLLEALTRLDQQRRYIAYYNSGAANTRFSLDELRSRANVEVRAVDLPLYSIWEQLRWPRVLMQDGVKIFHSPYVLLPFLARVRKLMTVHDLILERYPEYRPKSLLQRFYQPVTRLGIERAARVLTISEATAEEIKAYYRAADGRIEMIGNAIDASFEREEGRERCREIRDRYRLPDRYVLTIGAGRPHKNVEVLVEAFARIGVASEVKLVIGGDHDSRFPDRVGELIMKYGLEDRVIRVGKIREEDLAGIYSLATIFVFPSLVEGFGLPPLEAMACGTPVLTSTAPAVVEVVGDAALTFDARDVAHLVEVLGEVLEGGELRERLRRRGGERVKGFTWERVAHKTLEVYAAIDGVRKG